MPIPKEWPHISLSHVNKRGSVLPGLLIRFCKLEISTNLKPFHFEALPHSPTQQDYKVARFSKLKHRTQSSDFQIIEAFLVFVNTPTITWKMLIRKKNLPYYLLLIIWIYLIFIWQILVEAKAVLWAGRIGIFIQWKWAEVIVSRGFGA